jgi:hypothetical protein
VVRVVLPAVVVTVQVVRAGWVTVRPAPTQVTADASV